MERILVVGSNSFIAKHLIKRLIKTNDKIFGISLSKNQNAGITYYRVDILKYTKLKKIINKIKPTLVINLSGNNSHKEEDAKKVYDANFIGTKNLLKALRTLSIKKYICISTGEMYIGNIPYHERQMITFKNDYVLSKILMEYFIHSVYNIPYTILRLSVVYGPEQKGSMLIPSAIEALLKNDMFLTTKGGQTRDFIYVDDVVDAIILTLTNNKTIGEVINIGSGKEIKIKQVIEQLVKITKKSSDMISPTIKYKENETMRYCLNNKKANKLLGWAPKTTLSKGLKETVENAKK